MHLAGCGKRGRSHLKTLCNTACERGSTEPKHFDSKARANSFNTSCARLYYRPDFCMKPSLTQPAMTAHHHAVKLPSHDWQESGLHLKKSRASNASRSQSEHSSSTLHWLATSNPARHRGPSCQEKGKTGWAPEDVLIK